MGKYVVLFYLFEIHKICYYLLGGTTLTVLIEL